MDPFDDIQICQPCKEQNQNSEAVYWCVVCPELLCENCCRHHKALKATRNHRILGIQEYRIIRTSISELDTYCQQHPNNEMEYICLTHNEPCCAKCKHGNPCNVKLKEDVLKDQDERQKIKFTIEKTGTLLQTIQQALLSMTENAGNLKSKRNLFYEDIKNGRHRLDTFLNEYEHEVKQRFEESFVPAECKLEESMNALEKTRNELIKRKEAAEKVQELTDIPVFQKYMFNNQFHKRNIQVEEEFKSFSATTKDCFLSDATEVYEFKEQEKQIRLLNKFVIRWDDWDHSNMSTKDTDINESGSSTIEAEKELQENILTEANYNTHADASSTTEAGETIDKETSFTTEDTTLTTEAINEFHEDTSTETINVIPEDTTSTTEEKKEIHEVNSKNKMNDISNQTGLYKLVKSFFIDERNKDICLRCARYLTEDKVVLSETSQDRLLVYQTNSFKLGQVKFEDEPDEIAIIGSENVAVSVQKNLVFVDVSSFTIHHKKYLRDYIKGLAYANGNIYACLQHRGIAILDNAGNFLRSIPFIKGNLYLCVTNNDTIYTAKFTKSPAIHSYNVNSRRRELFHFNETTLMNGISCDFHGNVYAVNPHTVYKLDTQSSMFSLILSKEHGLKNVFNIDCFEGKLLIIDEGKQVKVFKKA